MRHPWEERDLNDYENHMRLESIQAMNELVKEQFAAYPAKSAMILGVAGGNGLDTRTFSGLWARSAIKPAFKRPQNGQTERNWPEWISTNQSLKEGSTGTKACGAFSRAAPGRIGSHSKDR